MRRNKDLRLNLRFSDWDVIDTLKTQAHENGVSLPMFSRAVLTSHARQKMVNEHLMAETLRYQSELIKFMEREFSKRERIAFSDLARQQLSRLDKSDVY